MPTLNLTLVEAPVLTSGTSSTHIFAWRHRPPIQDLDSVGRLMVNLTDPNSYQPGGRTWSVAFVGTAGDLELMTADAARLLPSPSYFARGESENNGYADDDDDDDGSIAYWPVDSATITVSETQRGEAATGTIYVPNAKTSFSTTWEMDRFLYALDEGLFRDTPPCRLDTTPSRQKIDTWCRCRSRVVVGLRLIRIRPSRHRPRSAFSRRDERVFLSRKIGSTLARPCLPGVLATGTLWTLGERIRIF